MKFLNFKQIPDLRPIEKPWHQHHRNTNTTRRPHGIYRAARPITNTTHTKPTMEKRRIKRQIVVAGVSGYIGQVKRSRLGLDMSKGEQKICSALAKKSWLSDILTVAHL